MVLIPIANSWVTKNSAVCFFYFSDETKNLSETSVGVKQVMDVINNVYGTTTQSFANSEENENSECYPLQQKLLICSILIHIKQGKKDITVGKVI